MQTHRCDPKPPASSGGDTSAHGCSPALGFHIRSRLLTLAHTSAHFLLCIFAQRWAIARIQRHALHWPMVELILANRWQVGLSDFTAGPLNKDVYIPYLSPPCVRSCYTEQPPEHKIGSALKCCWKEWPGAERLALCHILSATVETIQSRRLWQIEVLLFDIIHRRGGYSPRAARSALCSDNSLFLCVGMHLQDSIKYRRMFSLSFAKVAASMNCGIVLSLRRLCCCPSHTLESLLAL